MSSSIPALFTDPFNFAFAIDDLGKGFHVRFIWVRTADTPVYNY